MVSPTVSPGVSDPVTSQQHRGTPEVSTVVSPTVSPGVSDPVTSQQHRGTPEVSTVVSPTVSPGVSDPVTSQQHRGTPEVSTVVSPTVSPGVSDPVTSQQHRGTPEVSTVVSPTVSPGVSDPVTSQQYRETPEVSLRVSPGVSEAVSPLQIQETPEVSLRVSPGVSETVSPLQYKETPEVSPRVSPGVSETVSPLQYKETPEVSPMVSPGVSILMITQETEGEPGGSRGVSPPCESDTDTPCPEDLELDASPVIQGTLKRVHELPNKKPITKTCRSPSILDMRVSLPRTVLVISVAAVLLLVYLVVFKLGKKQFTQTCNHSVKFHEGLHNLAERAHLVLSSVGLTHFLCYGSLWGQLRLSRSLPWESDVEYCLLNEELITKDEVYLARAFRSKNMLLDYDSTEGIYIVTDSTLPGAKVELIVFEKDPMINMLRRVGWKRRVLPPDCTCLLHFSSSSSMNTIAHVSVIAMMVVATSGLTFFENHRYGEAQTRPTQSLRGYSGLQNQIIKERQEQLIKFIGERLIRTGGAANTNDYQPKDVISPGDVIGVLPSNVFKMPHKESSDFKKRPEIQTTAKPVDSDTGESQNVFTYKNLWSGTQFTPERIANQRYAESYRNHGLYEKPFGKVRVHTYRGPAKEYWVLPLHHKPQQKTYTPWGYYVKQPVGSEHHKFHSPLDLTFNFD
ncbi:hypothetical protein GE061_013073 [Apolygus lucorum]|uniref:Uncharacterized protein n=1 Tax=Apolygus lucorum TaxID=248454 RepID=A0A8S9XWA6_APOLU|nr:hypothetical protein GE061_013073 [Apolygus lucorum]